MEVGSVGKRTRRARYQYNTSIPRLANAKVPFYDTYCVILHQRRYQSQWLCNLHVLQRQPGHRAISHYLSPAKARQQKPYTRLRAVLTGFGVSIRLLCWMEWQGPRSNPWNSLSAPNMSSLLPPSLTISNVRPCRPLYTDPRNGQVIHSTEVSYDVRKLQKMDNSKLSTFCR